MTRAARCSEDRSEKPLVTIITTVHDLKPYVRRCIQSTIAQTYANWEQIIVDDGSTDGTEQIVREFADPRIRYIRLPKRGIAALAESYNVALANGAGSLVAVLEGDDFWPPQKLERQVAAFSDSEVQISWGRAVVVDERGSALSHWPRARIPHRRLPLEELFLRLTCANILTPTVTVVTRRTALEAVGGFHQPPGVLYVDLPTWLILSASVRGVAVRLDDILGYYRRHEEQMSTQYHHEYQTSQASVVRAMVGKCQAVDLLRVGWDSQALHRSMGASQLSAGVELLGRGMHKEARAHLKEALPHLSGVRPCLRAYLGLLSTLLPINLIAAADAARRKALAFSLKFSSMERASR